MLFSDVPRLLLALVAVGVACVCGFYRWSLGAASALLLCAIALVQIGWGAGPSTPDDASDPTLTILSFNLKDATADASTLAALVQRHRVDVLVPQEVKSLNCVVFSPEFIGFDFVWGDKRVRFEHDNLGSFSSMKCVRYGARISVQAVATGITGYRTFAAKLSHDDQPFWVVNVHTTKAFWLQGSLVESFRKAQYKSA